MKTVIIIPEHVKAHVDRIVAQYEAAYKERISFYSKITVGDKEYIGVETTCFMWDEVKRFRASLDTQELPFFQGTEEEVIKKIYNAIQDYYEPLSSKALAEVTKSVSAQKKLMKALKKAAKRTKETCQEARSILDYINNAKHMAWSQDDECIQRKIFKLVASEEAFDKILADRAERQVELTAECQVPFKKIRVAMVELSFKEQYQKKHMVKEYKKFIDDHEMDWSRTAFERFHFWHDVNKTAIYYVYIPS